MRAAVGAVCALGRALRLLITRVLVGVFLAVEGFAAARELAACWAANAGAPMPNIAKTTNIFDNFEIFLARISRFAQAMVCLT
jgi:hypothetical protein